jgi:hypothetical protein
MGSGFSGGSPRSRIVDDGFWLEGGNVPVGTRLRCRYVVGGQTQETEIVYDARPGGQFVFTGQRPNSVSIIVVPSGASFDSGMGGGAVIGSTLFDDDEEERRRRIEREEEERRHRSSSSFSAY